MDGIEDFLRLLEDGQWHRLEIIALELGWTRAKTLKLAEFLSEHGLVRYRSSDESVMIDPELSSLMQET